MECFVKSFSSYTLGCLFSSAYLVFTGMLCRISFLVQTRFISVVDISGTSDVRRPTSILIKPYASSENIFRILHHINYQKLIQRKVVPCVQKMTIAIFMLNLYCLLLSELSYCNNRLNFFMYLVSGITGIAIFYS